MFTVKDAHGVYQARDLDHAVEILRSDDRPATLYKDGEVTRAWAVRSIWEGELLSLKHFTYEDDANEEFESEMKFYLNLPDSHRAIGTTVAMYQVEDDQIIREHTFS